VTGLSATLLNLLPVVCGGRRSDNEQLLVWQQPLAWLLLALLTSSCASTPPTQPSDPDSAASQTDAESKTPPVTPPAKQPEAGDATLALLQLSQRAQSAGSLSEAIAYAERAIRINPRQADIWLRLATLELENEQPQSAIQYANKALSLADSPTPLERQAWLLIADARTALGDHEAADAIRTRWGTYPG
jgi:tetratricopeptide (TPR) repeat protein